MYYVSTKYNAWGKHEENQFEISFNFWKLWAPEVIDKLFLSSQLTFIISKNFLNKIFVLFVSEHLNSL